MITRSNMTAITTKYHGPTDRMGSRIIADAGVERRITVPYNYALEPGDNHVAAAQALCDKFEWKGDMRGGGLEYGRQVFVFTGI